MGSSMPTFPKRKPKDSDDFESRFPTDPIQTGAIGHLVGFLAVLNAVSCRCLHESDPAAVLIEQIAVHLDERRWRDVRPILKSLEDKIYLPIIELACAHAGMPGYADLIARRYAGIATQLVRAIRAYPPHGEGQVRIAAEAAMRMRHAIIQSAAWSAVGAGHHSYRRTGATIDHDTADQIACDLDAALSTSILDSIERRHRAEIERLRTLYQPRADSKNQVEVADIEVDFSDVPAKGSASAPSAVDGRSGIVVIRSIGGADTAGGRDAEKILRGITGVPTLLIRSHLQDIADAQKNLTTEFPYAEDVVARVLSDLRPGEPVRLRPTLLVGDPGGGKSRLAERICQEIGLPVTRIDAGSTSDKAIVGSPRRWSQSYPSLPLTVIERERVANPCIVIDELEKAGFSSAGSIHEPLLGLIDRRTAAAWHDQYTDAPVNLSFVNWIFTANGTPGIHPALMNRLRVLRVPRPGREHIPALAPRVLADLLAERGIDTRFESPLDGVEIEAIARAWKSDGGSIRDLQRLVEGVLDARQQAAGRN